MMRFLVALACTLFVSDLLAATQPGVLQRALRDELERSMNELSLEGLDAPYFIAYTVSEVEERSLHATDGALVTDFLNRWRTVQVEVRVGDYDFDNTNFGDGFQRPQVALLPLTDDYQELRRQLWLATDAAYKAALEGIAAKRAAVQNRIRDEEIPDFSREAVFTHHDVTGFPRLEAPTGHELVLALSAALRERPELQAANVMLVAQAATVHFINSEGTTYTRDTPFTGLAVVAGLQAADGRVIEDNVLAYAERVSLLPDHQALLDEVGALADRLVAQAAAPMPERYNGPVLFEGQAAAELFAQGMGHELVARRAPVGNAPGWGQQGGAAVGFQDRLGARVLPRFVGLVDDPTAQAHDGFHFPFSYVVDDEGVQAGPTTLVDRGRLRALLSGRTPTRDILNSTGNATSGGVHPSNIILTASGRLDRAGLEAELMALVDESGNDYGIVVTRLANRTLPSGIGGQQPWGWGGPGQGAMEAVEAFRLYPDGRRERVRNVQLVGVSPQLFRDIIAVGELSAIHTAPLVTGWFGGGGMQPGMGMLIRRPAASWAIPPLLFEDMTVRRPSGDNPSLPVVPAPAFAGD